MVHINIPSAVPIIFLFPDVVIWDTNRYFSLILIHRDHRTWIEIVMLQGICVFEYRLERLIIDARFILFTRLTSNLEWYFTDTCICIITCYDGCSCNDITYFSLKFMIPHEGLTPLHVCMSILLVDNEKLLLRRCEVLVDLIINSCEHSIGSWCRMHFDICIALTKQQQIKYAYCWYYDKEGRDVEFR